jgi:hypothetical protein
VAIAAPVPRPHHRLGRCCDRWMAISRHPEPCADPHPFLAVEADARSSFRPKYPPTVSPTDEREELDPCSLDPAALFGARLPSLFEARRRLPTSATTFDVRATKPELFSPRRDGGLNLLPFLLVSRPLPCGSGDPWRAALRPLVPTPVLVPPGCPGLPNRDVDSNAPPPRLAPAVHSED